MAEENKELERLQKLVTEQQLHIQRLSMEKYELLARVYPYVANELDTLRAQVNGDDEQ